MTESLTLAPRRLKAHNTVALPGSKSISNRTLLLAALADNACEISSLLKSDDTDRMLEALAALGIKLETTASGSLKILEVMAEATNIIAEGEVMQLMNIGNTEISETEYLQVIQYKTAKLFEAAAQVGAILAGATSGQEQALKDYGAHIGTAFQIIDDVLDYSGSVEQIGKNVGDDLAEGKPTLPLIYLMRNGSKQVADDVRHALENADRGSFQKIHDYVVHSDALTYSISEARKAVEQAVASLAVLPDSEVKQAMIQLAEESLARVS